MRPPMAWHVRRITALCWTRGWSGPRPRWRGSGRGDFMSFVTASARLRGRGMRLGRILAALSASALLGTLALNAVAAPARASTGDRMAYVANVLSGTVSPGTSRADRRLGDDYPARSGHPRRARRPRTIPRRGAHPAAAGR